MVGARRTTGRVLVLNASYEPINVCTVRRATVLVLKDRAEIIQHGEWALHSASLTVPRPVVIRLVTYIKVPRDAHLVTDTAYLLFAVGLLRRAHPRAAAALARAVVGGRS